MSYVPYQSTQAQPNGIYLFYTLFSYRLSRTKLENVFNNLRSDHDDLCAQNFSPGELRHSCENVRFTCALYKTGISLIRDSLSR